ncbi:MAG: hypothetical protein V1839_01555 [archaeon]
MTHKRARTKGIAKIEMKGQPRFSSTSFKKRQRRTPGGRTVTHYNYKKHSKHICAICKEVLHGKPRVRPAEMKHLGKSERKPERPFGGMLCSQCSRMIQGYRAKLKYKVIGPSDVPISLRGYIWL